MPRPATASRRPNTPPRSASSDRAVRAIGAAALTIAAIASLVLVAGHLQAVALPGCGPGSPCDQAAKSVWGKVPFTQVSTAALGAAYFIGMLSWWLGACASRTLRTVATIGMLASVLYVVVMIAEGWACKYCLAAHIANAIFVACVFWGSRGSPRGIDVRGIALAGGAGAIALGLLATIETNQRKKLEAAAKQQAAQSVEAMKAASQAPGTITPPGTQPSTAGEQPANAPSTQTSPPKPAAGTQSRATVPFEGRFRKGPAEAAIRIVMLTDYQCPDCKIMEGQLSRLLAAQPPLDIAVSIKHFPLSTMCNPSVQRDMHPDACFGAYAAEAAGDLGGADAFWQTHNWLFARDGKFTPQDIVTHGNAIGIDGLTLRQLMDDPRVQQRVKNDIEEGQQLGLRNTPMIFINGVELRGWMAPDALVNAVTQLAATNPPKRSAASDRPPLAEQRTLEIYANEPVLTLPAQFERFVMGPQTSPLRVVIIGDYQEPGTAEADATVRELLASGANVRYSFAHFPVSQACNPEMTFTRHEHACTAARLVEAAGTLGGPDAFFAAHAWAFANRTTPANLTAANLAQTIGESTGLTADALTQAATSSDATIAADARASKALGITGLPAVYINGKLVREWKLRDKNLLPQLLTP
jgi:protein-disulfide isomerase